jgi:hypothetical protein
MLHALHACRLRVRGGGLRSQISESSFALVPHPGAGRPSSAHWLAGAPIGRNRESDLYYNRTLLTGQPCSSSYSCRGPSEEEEGGEDVMDIVSEDSAFGEDEGEA